MEQTETVIITV